MGLGPSISFPPNNISEMDTFSNIIINFQFMNDAWSLRSLKTRTVQLTRLAVRACGCSSVRLSTCAEHAVGVVHSFSIAGTPNKRIAAM